MNYRRKINIAAVLAVIMVTVFSGMAMTAPWASATRQGSVGWQYETFTQNLQVNVTPESITTTDPIAVTITSKLDDVWISQASLYGVVYPQDGFQFPIAYPFYKVDNDEITYRCVIEPFAQFSSYEIEFYIVAYDVFNTPLDSRSNNLLWEYEAVGSGWKHDTFDENIELTYWPLRANATEEVDVIIRSKDNITMAGANLHITYETAEGQVEKGGWNFSATNVNSTEMKASIVGYPAGTNVTFWVIAWDEYNVQMVSKFYNYSVMGILEYTDFPFEYSDEQGNKDVWIPDEAVTLTMAGMCALGIPMFLYIYAITTRRMKRTQELVVKKTSPSTAKEEDVIEEAEFTDIEDDSKTQGGEELE